MSKARMVIALLVIAALQLAGFEMSRADSPAPIVGTVEKLASAWLGESDGSEYCRLVLEPSGRGLLMVQWYRGSQIDIYEVEATNLDGYSISFSLRPTADAEGLLLDGTVTPHRMDLEIRGANGNWDSKLKLEPEEDVLSTIRAVLEPSDLDIQILSSGNAR